MATIVVDIGPSKWLAVYDLVFMYGTLSSHLHEQEVSMRQYLLLTLLFAPGIVFAQAPDLEKTCVNVAKSFLLTDQITVGIVQSFPELKPPGVRMSYSTKPGAPKAEMSDIFECEFENPNPPHRLSRFCVSSTCYSPTEEDGERKRRFAEMRVVLDRAEARP